MFQMAYLLTSSLIAYQQRKFPRKKGVTVGFIAIIIATTGFGLLSEIKSE